MRFEPDVLVDVPRDDDASDAARRDDGRAIPQPSRSVPAYVLLASLSLVVLSLAQRPRIAAALPTFAQAYQVDCSVCHSMVPALNAYGRYVQSTAFAALDAGILRRAVPLVVREGVNYHSAGNLASNEPNDRYTYGNLSANLVGVLNKSFSYRFEQSLYENNVGGDSTGHFWIAYNHCCTATAISSSARWMRRLRPHLLLARRQRFLEPRDRRRTARLSTRRHALGRRLQLRSEELREATVQSPTGISRKRAVAL